MMLVLRHRTEHGRALFMIAHWVRYARALERTGDFAGAAWELAYCWAIRRAYLEAMLAG